jgi:hypothetical protein
MMSLKSVVPLTGAVLAICAVPAMVHAQSETHFSLQAVTATGASAWNGKFPFTLRGVLLCNPDEMLDSTPNYQTWNNGANQYSMGGEWQIIFQAVDMGDSGGTTCWMGQNYGNQPWIHNGDLSYTNEAWASEILRLNYDLSTLHPYRAGDLVEVTVRQSLSYGGKRNINEGHDIDPAYNFDIRLLKDDYGLPAPKVITLADVMHPGGSPDDWQTWSAIFDQTRTTGAELYQGMRVRLNNLSLLTTNGWNPTNAWGERLCTVTDGENRFFSLRHPRYSLGAAPTNQFDVVGIFSQESGSGAQGTNGYELFIQQVLLHASVPELFIGLNSIITWQVSGDSYLLESRNQVDTDAWSPVTNAPVLFNGMNTVILPPTNPQQFYQLRKTN